MIDYQLRAWRNQDAGTPVQTNPLAVRRPRDTDGKDEATFALERALVGQVVRLDKKVVRAHYESQLAASGGEAEVCA